jgi:hypothetical protein
MSDWRQRIEAQIAELRCFQVMPGKDDYCVWEGRGKCLNCQKADTMQALLDVAIAADAYAKYELEQQGLCGTKWCELDAALDKLREVGDE